MPSSPRKFIIAFFLVAVAALAAVPAINLRVDYSRVLTRDYHRIYGINFENLGFLKVHYVLDHKDEYDRLIFGSSRVRHGFNMADLDSILGGRWYKMEVPGASQYQHYEYLRYLIDHGFTPKEVILTVDDFDLWKQNFLKQSEKKYNLRMLPTGWRETFAFYWFYLYKNPGENEWKALRGDLKLMESNRVVDDRGADRPADEDSVTHDKKLQTLRPYQQAMANRNYRYQETLVYIQNFVRLCRVNEIPLRIAFLPVHPKSLMVRNHNAIRAFELQLVNTHPFYDFIGFSPETMNPSNWQEMSHFRTSLGRRVLRALGSEGEASGIFGARVNKANVQSHVNAVDRNVQAGARDYTRIYGPQLMSESVRRGQKGKFGHRAKGSRGSDTRRQGRGN